WGRRAAHEGAKALLEKQSAQTSSSVVMLNLPETLDQFIERNVEWLTDYQNARYARQYAEAVQGIRHTEQALIGEDAKKANLRLTKAVAKNLAKLMAYKDEYEVARLYADPSFLARLRDSFEGKPGRDY